MDYHHKYLKYKSKYYKLKKFLQGGSVNMVNANNILCMTIFNNLEGASKIFSPLGITFAIALLQLAATDKTEKEIYDLLGYKYEPLELESIHGLFNNDNITFKNIILVVSDGKINKEYADATDRLVTFTNHIDTMTQNIITENDLTQIVLINILNFRMEWFNGFNTSDTTRMLFHKTNMVDMMHQVNKFAYYENDYLQAIEMLYVHTDYVMGIILPVFQEENFLINTPYNIPKFTINDINNFIDKLEYTEVELYVPKFQDKKNIDLVPILQKLGVNSLFDPNKVNLNITTSETAISKFIHEVTINVDERGTNIASINTQKRSVETKFFRADHVFVYYIRHVPTNTLLFFGDYQGN